MILRVIRLVVTYGAVMPGMVFAYSRPSVVAGRMSCMLGAGARDVNAAEEDARASMLQGLGRSRSAGLGECAEVTGTQRLCPRKRKRKP